MIKKLEKCIKRYINDYLEKDWYNEDEFGDKINEIIDFINKKEEVTITVTPGEYNIWGNNPEIQKNYISKKELQKCITEFYMETGFTEQNTDNLRDKIYNNFNLNI